VYRLFNCFGFKFGILVLGTKNVVGPEKLHYIQRCFFKVVNCNDGNDGNDGNEKAYHGNRLCELFTSINFL
jgi:hypothetical protein